MDLSEYIDAIQRQFSAAADAGGEEARAVADRLFAPLESAIRLALQDALAAAAEEITCEMAPGSVEVRLRGRQPEFVVTPPRAEGIDDEQRADGIASGDSFPAEGPDGGVARINLRLPEQLKSRVEVAAGRDGSSVNSWLVRAVTTTLERTAPASRNRHRGSHGSQRFTGWAGWED